MTQPLKTYIINAPNKFNKLKISQTTYPIVQHTDFTLNTSKTETLKTDAQNFNYSELKIAQNFHFQQWMILYISHQKLIAIST